MKRKLITLHGSQALSSRNAAQMVQVSGKFKSMLWLDEGARHINAKSMMGILSLKLVGGCSFELIASGPDEAEAVEELTRFFQQMAD